MKDNKFRNQKIGLGVTYFLIVVLGLILINRFITDATTEKISYSKFVQWGEEGKIQKIEIAGDEIIIQPTEKAGFSPKIYYTTRIPYTDEKLMDRLTGWKVDYEGKIERPNIFVEILVQWVIPLLIFAFIWKYLMKGMENRMNGVMSFGKKTAKIYAENETGVTFKDVAGQEEAKESLREMVDFLNHPDKYTKIGAKLPKGALLVGPPGTGKTLLAKAVAGEADVPFFSISGSEFVQMFVGMGAAKVRDLFAQAQKQAPCIIFIDEMDAVGKSRGGSIGGGNDEREQTLNQLLTEMDGFDSSKGVVLLGATNRPEVLDKALLRPGRFDRRVIVDRPDLKGREAILRVHAKNVHMSANVNLLAIAKATSGAVGADLANMINEAALLAVKRNRDAVIQEDLEEALEVVIAGKEKKDRILSEHEKRSVAFHEVGHALVAALLPNADPVHKITIVPRTMGSLGYTMQLPDQEKYLITKEAMEDKIAVMLGGRAAEEVEFRQISTGASNDIERATRTARHMVTMYGMSEHFDMMAIESMTNQYLDGTPVKNCSDQTAAQADEEVLAIIKQQHKRAIQILEDNYDLFRNISLKLLEKENISGEEFKSMVEAEKENIDG